MPAGPALDPQECFNKALETMAALKPSQEAKKYSQAELQRLRAACSLTVAGMEAGLPNLHAKILEEGRTTKGIKVVPYARQRTTTIPAWCTRRQS
jgi:hypothetical protein